MIIDQPKKIYIADSKLTNAGRGVFAKEKIRSGELIESCPTLVLHGPKDRRNLRKTGLVNYYFLWGLDHDRVAICLGWGSIYNHSFSPNARYEKMTNDDRMDFYALCDIETGEEITVNYNGAPTDTRMLRIPGIPAHAGGPTPAKYPYLIEGLIRRIKLLLAYFLSKKKR